MRGLTARYRPAPTTLECMPDSWRLRNRQGDGTGCRNPGSEGAEARTSTSPPSVDTVLLKAVLDLELAAALALPVRKALSPPSGRTSMRTPHAHAAGRARADGHQPGLHSVLPCRFRALSRSIWTIIEWTPLFAMS